MGLLGLTGAATHPHHHRGSESDDPPAHWTGDKDIGANRNGQRDDGQSSGTNQQDHPDKRRDHRGALSAGGIRDCRRSEGIPAGQQ